MALPIQGVPKGTGSLDITHRLFIYGMKIMYELSLGVLVWKDADMVLLDYLHGISQMMLSSICNHSVFFHFYFFSIYKNMLNKEKLNSCKINW